VLTDEEGRARPLDARLALAMDLNRAAVFERDDVEPEQAGALASGTVDLLGRVLLLEEVERSGRAGRTPSARRRARQRRRGARPDHHRGRPPLRRSMSTGSELRRPHHQALDHPPSNSAASITGSKHEQTRLAGRTEERVVDARSTRGSAQRVVVFAGTVEWMPDVALLRRRVRPTP
jgi:hypothetical protein